MLNKCQKTENGFGISENRNRKLEKPCFEF